MSDVLPEWGIKLRKLIDRIAPVVNEHHHRMHALEDRVQKQDARIAQLERLVREQETKIALIQAKTYNL